MSNYPEWQAKARAIQVQAKARLLDKARARSHERAKLLKDILTKSGLENVPDIYDPHWVYEVYWLGDHDARVKFWLEYEGYHFSMAVTLKDIVTVSKGDVVVSITPYPDSDIYAVCDAIDKLHKLIERGVEVGAAD